MFSAAGGHRRKETFVSSQGLTVFYVASTHWDREWYDTFQGFRYHLVELLDEVLDTLERDPRYACFQTDGQSIILEDYLEIRPERAAQVRELAAAGRLRIGPWYTMPDECLVAGESLIRNLEEGLRVAADFGHASRVGFVPDMFGHTGQLPQILHGFGIDNAFIFRGVNEDQTRGTVRWIGSDGTEIPAFRFGPLEGYFDFAATVRHVLELDVPFELQDARGRLIDYVKMQQERLGLDIVLLFDGGDHQRIEPQMPDLLDELRKAQPEITVVHAGLEEFAAALRDRQSRIPRTLHGELREPGRLADGAWLIPGVLSSRIRHKQANRACETALLQWAEPFGLLAERLAAFEYPQGFLRRAWRYLLENHAHDSICTCSPDQIAKDMEYRFDQTRLIAERVVEQELKAITSRVELPDQTEEDYGLVVFNGTQADIDGPVDLELWFDEKTKHIFEESFRYEAKVAFRLYDPDGNELPYDYQSYRPRRRRYRAALRKVVRGQECFVVRVTVPLHIPAFGYTTLTCKLANEPTRHPAGTLLKNHRTLENEHLRVTVADNGSLTLLDKRTGQTYAQLLVFEERADIGDGWYHGVAVNDRVYTSIANAADVAIVSSGAHAATLAVTNHLDVPACFEFDTQMVRSARTVPLKIENTITLRTGADYVEIRTKLDNQARDHRVRVLFETSVQADTFCADSAFEVAERAIALPSDNHTYKELAVETTPQHNWTAVYDAARGLAIVAPGLPESGVQDTPERTLTQTLVRGYRRTIFKDDDEPQAQSLGRHEFHYCLVPLQGAPDAVKLATLAQRIAGGVRTAEVQQRDQAPASDRKLPRTLAPLALANGRLIISAYRRRPTDNRIELRVFNPAAEEVQETIAFAAPVQAAVFADLAGNESGPAPVKNGKLVLKVGARKIVTLLITHAS